MTILKARLPKQAVDLADAIKNLDSKKIGPA
jgi:hypothetical protein